MTVRKIALIGEPVLRQRARKISREELLCAKWQAFIDDLIETMHAANGAGLAANQIFEPVQMVAVEVKSNNPRYPYKPSIPLTVMVNPVITPISAKTFQNFEGCLSVPNLRGMVKRSMDVQITFWNRDGQEQELTAHGLTAGTYQHECDHLEGKLFLDRVEDTKTLCTWEAFEKYHRDDFVKSIISF